MQGSVTVHIKAPPDRVFALISDITNMGKWSPETISATWLPPYEGPQVGARFEGTNKGPKGAAWTTQCTVMQFQPIESFVFQVQRPDGKGTTWGYRLTPTGDGCQVEEFFDSPRRNSWLRRQLTKAVIGVGDRKVHNEGTMQTTLTRLKAAAESAH